VASIKINLFVNISIRTTLSLGYSDDYTNKLCKFRRGQQKLGDLISVFIPLVEFLSEACSYYLWHLNSLHLTNIYSLYGVSCLFINYAEV